jgi:hypothetical protein
MRRCCAFWARKPEGWVSTRKMRAPSGRHNNSHLWDHESLKTTITERRSMLRRHSRTRGELTDHNSLSFCHPDRSRSGAASYGEWRDPDTFSCFMPHQGVLTKTIAHDECLQSPFSNPTQVSGIHEYLLLWFNDTVGASCATVPVQIPTPR